MTSRQYGLSPFMVCTSMSSHWNLLCLLTKREIVSRYRGSLLGVVWAFLHPTVMLAVYTIVFRGAFGMRWGRDGESALDFGLLLFSGLIIHALFAESIHRAPYLIVNHINRLWLEVLATNERAYKLYERCGFKVEGRLREAVFLYGQYTDYIVISCLKREYRKETM